MKLEEIIAAASKLNLCSKCGSKEGFWLGVNATTPMSSAKVVEKTLNFSKC